jgi:hypothetical protein
VRLTCCGVVVVQRVQGEKAKTLELLIEMGEIARNWKRAPAELIALFGEDWTPRGHSHGQGHGQGELMPDAEHPLDLHRIFPGILSVGLPAVCVREACVVVVG